MEESDQIYMIASIQDRLSAWLEKESWRLTAIQRTLTEKGLISLEDITRHTKELEAAKEVEIALSPELWEAMTLVRKVRKLFEYLDQGFSKDEARRLVDEEFGKEG